jgi:hypothetical protein
MPEMPDLNFSLPKLGGRGTAQQQKHPETEVRALSPAERREDLERYIESDEFADHNEHVAELLLDGDEDGLVEFVNEGAAEEAAARVAEIRGAR